MEVDVLRRAAPVYARKRGPWRPTGAAALYRRSAGIEVFHTDRGSEFDNAEIDLMLETFGIERSLSAKGCPHDSAVDESTNRILKAELVHRETFGTTRELRAKLSDYVHRYNNFRIHSASPAVDRPASAVVTLALE